MKIIYLGLIMFLVFGFFVFPSPQAAPAGESQTQGKYVNINDVNVYYEVYGEGKPILMIHGFGVDSLVMKKCMEPIFNNRPGWKRIYYDLPTMGNTRPAPWIKSSNDLLKLTNLFVEKIIPGEKFVVAGQSYGGYLARAMVHENPANIEGVLLICPLIYTAFSQRDVPPVVALKTEETLLSQLSPQDKTVMGRFITVHNQKNYLRLKEEMLDRRNETDKATLEELRKNENYELNFNVDDLSQPYMKPSLIFTGRQDCLVGYKDSWKILEKYPRATFVILDMSGHALQIEQEALFNGLVNEFLDRLEDKK